MTIFYSRTKNLYTIFLVIYLNTSFMVESYQSHPLNTFHTSSKKLTEYTVNIK